MAASGTAGLGCPRRKGWESNGKCNTVVACRLLRIFNSKMKSIRKEIYFQVDRPLQWHGGWKIPAWMRRTSTSRRGASGMCSIWKSSNGSICIMCSRVRRWIITRWRQFQAPFRSTWTVSRFILNICVWYCTKRWCTYLFSAILHWVVVLFFRYAQGISQYVCLLNCQVWHMSLMSARSLYIPVSKSIVCAIYATR